MSDVAEVELFDLADTELRRRLTNDPGSVPAGVLEKLLSIRLKRMEDERPVAEPDFEFTSPLEWIEKAGLPRERKAELVKEEVQRLEEQYEQAVRWLAELEAPVE